MKINYLICSIIFLLSGCSDLKQVKPMMNIIPYQGSCKLVRDDVLKFQNHVYPHDALMIGQEGWVVLKFDLENGIPTKIEVIGSSPKGIFESAAVNALSHSLYNPKTNKEGCITVRNFKIKNIQ